MTLHKHMAHNFSPLYFLAALGNGGMTITFFIYLMFLTPHPDTPIPTFDSVQAVLTSGNFAAAAGVLLAMAGMIVFAARHFWTLAWNLREYATFRSTSAYSSLLQSNGEIRLMALPLTLAMSVNVLFVMGAVFVPGLWSVVEYLFPFSLLAFFSIGIVALRLLGSFMSRVLTSGTFDCARNNSLSQMIAVLALSMVSVGFAASAAMSHTLLTVTVGMLGSIFFLSAAILLGLVSLVLGFRSMLEHGIDQEASMSLWVLIPILTLMGITWIRLSHGLHHHFATEASPASFLVLTSAFLSLQLLFGALGYSVMRRVNYFQDFVRGERKSPGSYALICPGVALFVFGMFFIHAGLLKNGVITSFSAAHLLLLAPLVYVQALTIRVMLKLDRKLLRREPDVQAPGADLAGTA